MIRWSRAAHTTVSLHQPFVRCSSPALPFHSASVATALGLLPPKKQKPFGDNLRKLFSENFVESYYVSRMCFHIFWAFLIPGNSKKDDPFWESNKQHSDRANPPPHRSSFVQAVGQGWPQTPGHHFWCSLICWMSKCTQWPKKPLKNTLFVTHILAHGMESPWSCVREMPPVPHAAEQYKQSQAALSSDAMVRLPLNRVNSKKLLNITTPPENSQLHTLFFGGGGKDGSPLFNYGHCYNIYIKFLGW